ncbi:putative acetolactate synthase large subunit [Bradyrhizobiaceae bacterium SG-6C]|nr:putative acetolactate synthase large subunit [Bradyrhizobiaceae bacterium SG-6C]
MSAKQDKTPRRMSGGRYIAETMRGYGVTHVFFVDAILRRTLVAMEDLGIRRILAHSEKGAAYMADGYARIARRPGVCMAQSVGAANLAAGLQDPYLGFSPVIAITGRHIAANQYRNAYQELPHDQLFQAVTKSHAKVELLQQLPQLLRQAFRDATSGSPRPVHLDVAGNTGDVLASAESDAAVEIDEAHARIPAYRVMPDLAIVEKAVAALAKSERPVIVADRGAAISGAGAAVTKLADVLDCPFVVTLDAKDLVVHDHPRFGGLVGTYGRSCANRIVAEADLVIFVGSNTSDMTTAFWKMPAQGTAVIQIDIDPAELGRNYAGTIGLQADPVSALDAFAAGCDPRKRAAWSRQAREHVAAWRAEKEPAFLSNTVPMRPERLCRALTDVLPANAILVSDTGYSAHWSGSMIELNHPGQSYIRAAGSLGWAFPASLGAKCAAPDRPVICFTGDGAFYYHLPELETALRYGIKTVTVVNNNRCLAQGLANINVAYHGHTGKKEEIYAFRPTDFAKVAESMDCLGLVVERPEDFAKAFAEAMASDIPAVIDVRTEFGAQASPVWVPA